MIENARWLAVYGAAVSAQVFEHMREGRGAPESEDFDRMVDEAKSIADSSEEAWERLEIDAMR